MDSDLFHPYEKLVEIEVLGHRVQVPDNNTLLRCFQYLSLQTISYGDFCWNGDCTNCQVWFRRDDTEDAADKPVLSCRTQVREGMVITRMSPFVKLEGITTKM
jgi:NADH dehydrogenase/NADH:ubiquinone oxidoreductase subunit G